MRLVRPRHHSALFLDPENLGAVLPLREMRIAGLELQAEPFADAVSVPHQLTEY